MGSVLVLDLGGSNLRSAYVANGRLVAGTLVKENFNRIKTPKQLANLMAYKIGNRWRPELGQKNIVLSVAGPVMEDHRTIEILPNVLGNLQRNICLSYLVEEELNRYGIRAKLHIINDGPAAVLAEMSARGALSKAQIGFAYIIGTGVGGAAAQRDGYVVKPFEFFKEFGHYTYDKDPATGVQCGCGKKGCLETVSSGLAAERIAKQKVKILRNSYPNSLLLQSDYIDNTILADAIKEDDELAWLILDELTWPTAYMVQQLFTAQPAIQIAFVGGFVRGVGEPYIRSIERHIKDKGQTFSKKVAGRLHLGNVPPDETNLIGAAEYWKSILPGR